MKGLRFIPENLKTDYVRLRYITLSLSFVVIFGTIGLLFMKGLNFGIDFTGGTAMEIETPIGPDKENPILPDIAEMRKVIDELGIGEGTLQTFGADNQILIRLPQQDGGPEAQSAAVAKVRTALETYFEGKGELEVRKVEYVGPQVGDELKMAGVYAVLLSVLGIMGYVWVRFEWQYGISTLVTLLHDVLATLGLFIVTGMQFDLSIVAAILMVAGYSMNDTVVVFDRIRENLRKYKRMQMRDILNNSVNETLPRTIMTSVATLLALLALWLFGGDVIQGFVNALFFGILVGTYSSIFIAAPCLMYLDLRKNNSGAGEDTAQAAAQR